LPVDKYFKLDKSYVVKDSTVFEFTKLTYDSIIKCENIAKTYLRSLTTPKENLKTLQTYHYIINANLDLKRLDSALVYLYKALEIPKSKNSKGAINIYWSIFRIYSYSENYLSQLEQIKPLEDLGIKHNYFKDTEPLNLKKIKGDVLFTAGYFKEASEFYTKYLIKNPLAFDPLRYSVVTNDLACIYEALNIPDSVTKYRNIALQNLKSKRPSTFEKHYASYIKDFIKLHDIWYKKDFSYQNLKFAKLFLENARKNYEGETHTAIYANHFIATYYFHIGKQTTALFHINKAIKLWRKKLNLSKLEKLNLLKIRILDKLGNKKMSSEIIQKLNIIKSNKLAEIRNINLIKYEVNKIKSEKVKAEKLALSIEIKRQNTFKILILLILILVITFIALNVSRRKNIKIKLAQNEINQKLKEKEFLLKELNHRVNNNLSLILSLIKFQSDEVTNENFKNKFKNLEYRVRTIAIAHEQLLYNENDLLEESFTLEDYLSNIANALLKISIRKVKLNLITKDIKLNIDTLLPIGILINELISNSLKHGVTSEEELKIDIRISFKKNDIEIIYKDSGILFKTSKHKTSLGLTIIESMVEQLKGNIKRIASEYFITLKLKNTKR
jgi:two-component sensor histidine kinase